VWQWKPEREQKEETKQSRWGFRGKTVWDWLDLLLVPLVVGIVAAGLTAWFNVQQDAPQNDIENQRAKAERKLAEQRAQEDALQAYLDQMSTLLLARDLRSSTEDNATEDSKEARTLARARTLTVLRRLYPSRKKQVMQFLLEANLVKSADESDPVIILEAADFKDTNMPGTNLSYVDLTYADLRYADLRYADLVKANLGDANLSHADLNRAHLIDAYLSDDANLSVNGRDLSNSLEDADLKGTNLSHANLSGAYLRGANLSDATLIDANLGAYRGDDIFETNAQVDLSGANLSGANLSGANLTGATGVTNKELAQQASSLEGATMPNGQKYEEWIKDRESRKEDGENDGSS
jgi:uncharacterized protein YjbI with pentapeptide repeats